MDIKEIKKLVELVRANELVEFELEEPDFRVSIKAAADAPVVYGPAAQPQMMMAPAATLSASAPAAPEAAAKDEEAGLASINSPIVGTFYRSPSPDAAPFVKAGDRVEEDTVVCIVEAMKVMNEIKAECKGVIKKVMLENGTAVEYGQELFKIDPAG
ncbi:MAG: acetyl-CoA carboxylase biotin carboxyl carrier protein [Kiritimatiellae bacterium]|nr:acetyl-CoA carboxylase biotin carboxyl carrier protein [Kiritimatiellia bacterium]